MQDHSNVADERLHELAEIVLTTIEEQVASLTALLAELMRYMPCDWDGFLAEHPELEELS
jgi:hypothetical protein